MTDILRNPPWPGPRVERPEDRMLAAIKRARELFNDTTHSPIDAMLIADKILLDAIKDRL